MDSRAIETIEPSPPRAVTFRIAVALAVLGALASQGVLSGLASYDFWLVVAGFVVLALGNLMKGM